MLYYTKANYKPTMTKRPHLTVEEVLESVLSDEEDADNQEELCDPEEPIMEGSDDEFSDIEWDDDETLEPYTHPSMSSLSTDTRDHAQSAPMSR